MASLPQALKPDEVARLLASFNASLPSPKRGYAIVRCALDLGLRRGEIAPHDQPIGPDAIHRVIRDAYRCIGLKHGRTHALRHTLACNLVNHGSSLKEVADVLRHRSLNTSLIYAKLDNSKLAAVALPWPGSTT